MNRNRFSSKPISMPVNKNAGLSKGKKAVTYIQVNASRTVFKKPMRLVNRKALNGNSGTTYSMFNNKAGQTWLMVSDVCVKQIKSPVK